MASVRRGIESADIRSKELILEPMTRVGIMSVRVPFLFCLIVLIILGCGNEDVLPPDFQAGQMLPHKDGGLESGNEKDDGLEGGNEVRPARPVVFKFLFVKNETCPYDDRQITCTVKKNPMATDEKLVVAQLEKDYPQCTISSYYTNSIVVNCDVSSFCKFTVSTCANSGLPKTHYICDAPKYASSTSCEWNYPGFIN